MQASLKLRGNNRSSKRRWAHYLDAGGRESLRSLKRPCCPRSLKSLSSGGRSWRWATAAVEVDLEDELQVGSGGVHDQRVMGDPGGGCLRWCGAPSPASPNPRLPAPGAASLPAPGVVRLPPNSPRSEGGPDRLDVILTCCPRAKPLLLKWAKSKIRPAPILLKHSPIQSYPLFRKAHNES